MINDLIKDIRSIDCASTGCHTCKKCLQWSTKMYCHEYEESIKTMREAARAIKKYSTLEEK